MELSSSTKVLEQMFEPQLSHILMKELLTFSEDSYTTAVTLFII